MNFVIFLWNFDLEHCSLMVHLMLTNILRIIEQQNSYDLCRTVINSFTKIKLMKTVMAGRAEGGGGVKIDERVANLGK